MAIYVVRIYSLNKVINDKFLTEELEKYGEIKKIKEIKNSKGHIIEFFVYFKVYNKKFFINLEKKNDNYYFEGVNKSNFKIKIIYNLTIDNSLIKKKLFLGGLHIETKKKDIFNLFSTYGKLKNINIIPTKEGNKKKLFGFINFMETESSIKAYKDISNHFIKDKWIEITIKKNNTSKIKEDRIFFKNTKNIKDDLNYNDKIILSDLINNLKNSNSHENLKSNLKISKVDFYKIYDSNNNNIISKLNSKNICKEIINNTIKNLN